MLTKDQLACLELNEEPKLVPSSWENLVNEQKFSDQKTKCQLKSPSSAAQIEVMEGTEEEPVLAEQLPQQEQKRRPLSEKHCLEDEEEIATSPTQYFEDEATVEEILEQLEYVYLEHRNLVVHSTGFISTPLHALKELALKFNEPMHNEVMYVKMNGFDRPVVRVEIIVGIFRGTF